MAEKKPAAKTVDEYFATASPRMLPALQSLRAVIRETAPAAEEAIRMGAPTYLYHGNLVSFAAAAKHCAFYVMSPGPIMRRKTELKDYDIAPTAIRFRPDVPIPNDLVAEIVRDRLRENKAKA